MPHSSKYARLSLFLLVLLVAAIGVNAYDAVPLIAWSGKKFATPKTTSLLARSEIPPILDSIGCKKINVVFDQRDVSFCEFYIQKAVGLWRYSGRWILLSGDAHALLQSLELPHLQPATINLRRLVNAAASSVKVAFVEASENVDDVVKNIQRACEMAGKKTVIAQVGKDGLLPALESGSAYILTALLPSFRAATMQEQISAMSKNDDIVGRVLTQVSQIANDDWAAVFTGSRDVQTLHRRQAAFQNSAIPWSKRPIFQKYVFLNGGLFMCISAMVPVVVVALVGVRILSSIQTPSRFETKKKEK